jgi:hypothetical protein
MTASGEQVAAAPRRRRGRRRRVLAAARARHAGAGAGGGSAATVPRVVTLGEGEVFPEIANHTLAVGENRFVLVLFDKENEPILGANVHLRFFDLSGDEQRPGPEADAREIRITRSFTHEHPDGIIESHHAGETAFHTANVRFDAPGRWGVEISGSSEDDTLGPVPFQFDVLEESPEPAVGELAPPSRQPTLAEVADVGEIDSSSPLRPHMHETTVADALATGRPIVLAFATPSFCVTRICGPVMDEVIDPLYEKYRDRAVFIHIEPYRLKEARAGLGLLPVEAMAEWGLSTEPWVFVIDGEGKVAAKFEGIMVADEVESVLRDVLGEA